jgi:hypothetical protein
MPVQVKDHNNSTPGAITKYNGSLDSGVTKWNGITYDPDYTGGPYSGVISQSAMFESASSTYLSLGTSDGADDATKGSLSVWFKRSKVGASQTIISGDLESGNSADYCMIKLGASDDLQFYMNNASVAVCRQYSNAKFRDCSGWYHLVFIWDSTSAVSAAARQPVMYINGNNVETELGGWGTETASIAQNTHIRWCHNNTNSITAIGRDVVGSDDYYSGYMSYFEWVDGLALTHASFGETKTGIWVPKAYSGSYGTTGFKLTFADNTSFGDDTSGGTNDFTDNNFGTDHQVTDTPTNNFCTINAQNCHGSMTTGQGGLYSFWGSASWLSGMFSFGPIKSGKWYFEGKQLTTHSTTRRMMIGIGDAGKVSGMALKNNYYIGQGAAGIDFSIYYNYDSGGGSDYRSVTAGGGTTEASLGTPAQNDVLQVAFDADNNKMWIGKNNTWIGDPGAGTGETFNNATDSLDFQLYDYVPCFTNRDQGSEFHFGQGGYGDFTYTPPTGFKAMYTANLPDPSILEPTDGFGIITYAGDSAGSPRSITGLDFQPDLVWIKDRDAANLHCLFDSVRGVNKNVHIEAIAEETTGTYGYVSSFDSNGFTLTQGGSGWAEVNNTGRDYVAWCWKKGAEYGFDIQTYAGTGVAKTETHDLGGAPELIIVKPLDLAWSLACYHHNALNKTDPETDGAYPDATNVFTDLATFWNDTAPTSSVFSLGSGSNTNGSGYNYVAWLWRSIPGYSNVGSYYGNSNAAGPYVYCGFRPKYVVIKLTAGAANWWSIHDAERGPYNGHALMDGDLAVDLASAEPAMGAETIDFYSNGFKIRNSRSVTNYNNYVMAYWAFAEQPYKYANAR